MDKKIKIGIVQARVSSEIEENLKKTAKFVKQAAGKGAKIVCLPELFASPYFCQIEDKKKFELAEKIPGKITSFLSLSLDNCTSPLIMDSRASGGQMGSPATRIRSGLST